VSFLLFRLQQKICMHLLFLTCTAATHLSRSPWFHNPDNIWRSTGWSKIVCAPDDYSTKNHGKIQYFKQNTFGIWTVLYWTRSSRTQFGVSINVWRLAGHTLNTTCNFLYCNHQVHGDFLITLYKHHDPSEYAVYSTTLLPPLSYELVKLLYWFKREIKF